MDAVKVFAPATIANLGPGFDVLGLAVTGLGDKVEAVKTNQPGVFLEAISGDGGKLPRQAEKNTAGVAAQGVLDILGVSGGVSLKLHKGLPLGSGLGSSAASAAAALWATALLYDSSDKFALLPAGLAAEAMVGGYHADNIAPSLMGGLALIQRCEPGDLQIHHIPTPENLYIVLVNPDCQILTSEARKVTPQRISLQQLVANTGNLGALLIASFQGNVPMMGAAMMDEVVEPARAKLIPGFDAVKQAAFDTGAYGCSIGGSGPTVFAISDNLADGRTIGQAMQAAFLAAGLDSKSTIAQVDLEGARQIQ